MNERSVKSKLRGIRELLTNGSMAFGQAGLDIACVGMLAAAVAAIGIVLSWLFLSK